MWNKINPGVWIIQSRLILKRPKRIRIWFNSNEIGLLAYFKPNFTLADVKVVEKCQKGVKRCQKGVKKCQKASISIIKMSENVKKVHCRPWHRPCWNRAYTHYYTHFMGERESIIQSGLILKRPKHVRTLFNTCEIDELREKNRESPCLFLSVS